MAAVLRKSWIADMEVDRGNLPDLLEEREKREMQGESSAREVHGSDSGVILL